VNAAATSRLERVEDRFAGRFVAMASPCEVLVDTDDARVAAAALEAAEREARRVETKFSRYRTDNVVHAINHAGGRPVTVDDETAALLDYARTCWDASAQRFDITSGALRRAWVFDGSDHTPDDAAVRGALALVGWQRVTWRDRTITMPAGMELDFGGIGKEYAVDRASAEVAAACDAPHVVNFGGDLVVSGPRRGARDWAVGVDDPARTGDAALWRLELARGGLATSGDARRFVMHRGRRLGHILDPTTGWPVEGAPRSVTVLATTCLEAGTLSTLACLEGSGARAFLDAQGVRYWIVE